MSISDSGSDEIEIILYHYYYKHHSKKTQKKMLDRSLYWECSACNSHPEYRKSD